MLRVAFLDHPKHWKLLCEQHGADGWLVKTSSPLVLADKTIPSEHMEADRLDHQSYEFCSKISEATDALWSALDVYKKNDFWRVAMVRCFQSFAILCYRASWLKPEDFSEPRVVVVSERQQHLLEISYWPQLLASNPHLTVIKASGNVYTQTDLICPSFLDRLRGETKAHLEFTLWQKLWSFLPGKWQKKSIGIVKDNPLIDETANAFARNGYAIRRFQNVKPTPDTPNELKISNILLQLMEDYLSDFIVPEARPDLVNVLAMKLEEEAARYDQCVELWRNQLSKAKHLSHILSNFQHPALADVCHSLGVKLVDFQHGVTREIATYRDWRLPLDEEVVADYFITYNHEAKVNSEQNPYARATVVSAGMPAVYWQSSNYRKARHHYDLIYVSTNLYVAHTGPFYIATWDDYRKAAFEKRLIDEIFAQIPMQVLVKPYPSQAGGYEYAKALLPETFEGKNITFDDRNHDFHYLAPDAKILFTCRSTSTLSWCLMADKPLVFIDLGCHYEFRDIPRDSLRDAVFYFDYHDPKCFEKIRALLSLPVPVIRRLWAKKLASRQDFIGQYVVTGGLDAGKRAYLALRKAMDAAE